MKKNKKPSRLDNLNARRAKVFSALVGERVSPSQFGCMFTDCLSAGYVMDGPARDRLAALLRVMIDNITRES